MVTKYLNFETITQIVFLSTVNINTKRAYAITIKNTMSAVKNLGINTTLIAPDAETLTSKLEQSKRIKFWSYLQRYARSQFNLPRSIISPLYFILFEVSFLVTLRLVNAINGKNTIWTRSLLAPLILGKNHRYLIEIHQPLSKRQIFLLFVYTRLQFSMIVAPISRYLYHQLESSRLPIESAVLLPMAITDDFLRDNYYAFKDKYDIGYFGSLRMNGNNQGIFMFIEQLIICKTFNPKFKCVIVGFSESEVKELCDFFFPFELLQNWITFYPRLEHYRLPQMLQECRYLVLPYKDDDFNAARHPLKAFEYAASGRPILASNTRGHRNIFDDSEVFFYEHQDRLSLQKLLFSLENEFGLSIPDKSRNARRKALEQTYRRRALMALSKLDKL